jgi:transposase
VPVDPEGYDELIEAAARHGRVRAFAVEGAGGYGAGLARHLATAGEVVVELDRPKRPARRGGRKSDPIDAERAARDALARTQLAAPKTGPQRGALAALQTARRSAVQAATDAQRQLRALVITAPEPVRARFRGHRSTRAQLAVAAALRPATSRADTEVITTTTVLRELARRVRALETEAAAHEKAIHSIVAAWRPDLLELPGVGPINAAAVLTAWSHPERCRNDAAFAMLAGVAPIPASSGKTVRYRLNRAGDRQLNRALHSIAVSRQRYHQPTRDYTARRKAQAKTDREIRRCLKRYIARQLYRQLEAPPSRVAEP